ncbi:MAG: YciI family protein, partial [OM182 bacterium]|nr:YciI family protein [OM182 bacterium]
AIELKNKGNLIAGGAILDDAGSMIGSTTYVEFESRAELDAWLERDPYVTGDVWRDITITPIRLAV